MLLAEKLGLVVLTTRTGRGDFELASVDVACSGLLLIDLVLAGRVADDGDGLVVVKRKKLAAPLLNEALTALSAKNQQSTRRQLAAVGRRLGGRSEQTSRAVFDQLVEDGYAERQGRRLSPTAYEPHQDSREAVIDEIQSAALDEHPPADGAVLLSLLEPLRLLKAVFPIKVERKAAKHRGRDVLNNLPVDDEVATAIGRVRAEVLETIQTRREAAGQAPGVR